MIVCIAHIAAATLPGESPPFFVKINKMPSLTSYNIHNYPLEWYRPQNAALFCDQIGELLWNTHPASINIRSVA